LLLWQGTSPEFEMALYTLCFVAGQEENIVQIGGYDLKIRCYRIRSKYGDKIGSVFPEARSTPCHVWGSRPPTSLLFLLASSLSASQVRQAAFVV
jgi:Endoribonuclease XendoU